MAGPPMMPPGGGGQNGGDIANQLMELVGPILASPKGQQMAQAIMAQMGGGGGGDPMAMMQQMMGGGGGMPTPPPQGGSRQMNPLEQGGGRMGSPDMEAMTQGGGDAGPNAQTMQNPSTEAEMAMVQGAINGGPEGGGGGGAMNSDGPTPQEVQLLKSNPSPRNMQNFDKLFGPGAAQTALGGADGGGMPPSGGSTYEDDVKGAMDDADEGDHEYR